MVKCTLEHYGVYKDVTEDETMMDVIPELSKFKLTVEKAND